MPEINRPFCVVLVTAPSLEEAKNIAKGLLEEKLAACVNVVNGVESFYWWEGKIENSAEVLLVVKTVTSRIRKIQEWVQSHHSYTVPEIIALPILQGSRPYLDWVKDSLT